ncbi:MAG: DNA-processing protein DprA [Salinisphaeraceae bacterium]|nr:DNA-processing protein DprA [Salinisphaeraceae bacterium]
MTAELRPWLGLLRVAGLGPAQVQTLLEHYGNPAVAFEAGKNDWKKLGIRQAEEPDWSLVDADQRWLEADNHHLITLEDARYPERLKDIARPPPALFCLGDPDLLDTVQFALVGSRNPTPQGTQHALEFAATLAQRGLVITSGLAMGVDAAAHEGALSVQGYTVAVCGTGLDRVYPARNQALARQIAESGLLVSEFSPGMKPMRENFPRRNRIISGLSLGVLVVEAAIKSGSLITARLALEQGREVFAIPGSVHNPLARGCHRLIREGAKLVEQADDILEEIAGQISLPFATRPSNVDNAGPNSVASTDNEALDAEYEQLLQAMGHAASTVDELVDRSGLTAETVSSMLLILELQGRVSSAPGGAYMINPS